jgi:hypothetical protein
MKHTLKIVNNMSKSVLSMGNGFIDRQYLWEEKVGYDSANKKMIARVYEALRDVVEGKSDLDKSWANVVRYMFVHENREKQLRNIRVNGYYNSIKRNLKQLDIIRYEGRKLVKGSNWDRFYSDEDWSWFITDTASWGQAKIVK